MKKFYLLLLAFVACMAEAYASKAVPRAFEVTLNDGRRVTVMLRGDEHLSYYATAKGELVLCENNTWRLMTEDENKKLQQAYSVMRAKRAASVSTEKRPFPHVGTPKALVIMVSYSDNEFTYGKEDIDRWLNSKEYKTLEQDRYSSYGSVAQFFSDNSNGV